VGFNNPDVPWSRLEAVLSGRPSQPAVVDPLAASGDGGDSPAWSRKRTGYAAPELVRGTSTVDYVELHCHTNFSFLDGASHPEELVEEAYQLGLAGLAVTDHDGLYGVVRFADAARELGIPTVFGAELSLELPGPQNGTPDPAGRHLLVLARGPEGYAGLSRVISLAQLAGGEKGRPVYDLDAVGAALGGRVVVLTGCRKGHVPAALYAGGIDAAAAELDRLVALFGVDGVVVELSSHGYPDDDERNDALAGPRRPVRVAGGGDGERALPPARPAPPGPSPRRRAGAPVAGRDGRLAPRRRWRLPAVWGRDGRPVRPLPRRGRYGGTVGDGAGLRPGPDRSPPATLPGRSGAHGNELAAASHRAGRAAALWHARAGSEGVPAARP